MVGINIANRTTKFSQNCQQNNSETDINENDKEICKERLITPEERQKIIDEMSLINFLENTPNQPTKFRTK